MTRLTIPYDNIGIIASVLCMIHCIGTPFLFFAKACVGTCCADSPIWWQVIDYLFLIISFTAIYFITKNTTIKWLKFVFWTTWFILFITLLDHSFAFNFTPKNFIYIPATLIVGLHFYNIKFCECNDTDCCFQPK